jgi:hypothetical protein
MAFQPLDGDEVEVVGRLVEQQDVGLHAEHADERRPPRLASGHVRRVRFGVKPEVGHHGAGGVRIVMLAQALEHIVADRGVARQVGLLRQEREARGRLLETGSAIRDGVARSDAQQRRLARPVATDERDPLARGDR